MDNWCLFTGAREYEKQNSPRQISNCSLITTISPSTLTFIGSHRLCNIIIHTIYKSIPSNHGVTSAIWKYSSEEPTEYLKMTFVENDYYGPIDINKFLGEISEFSSKSRIRELKSRSAIIFSRAWRYLLKYLLTVISKWLYRLQRLNSCAQNTGTITRNYIFCYIIDFIITHRDGLNIQETNIDIKTSYAD